MENLIEILAILLFLVLTGAQSVGKKMRDQQKKQEEDKSYSAPSPTTPPRTPSAPAQSTSKTAPSPRPPQPETPPPTVEEPTWSRMLREMLNMEEYKPEPVFESTPKKKLFQKKKTESAQKTRAAAPPPSPKPVYAKTPPTQTHPILESILKRAEKDPLRTAVLLSEIIQPPLAKRVDRRRI